VTPDLAAVALAIVSTKQPEHFRTTPGGYRFPYLDEPLTGRRLDGENGHLGFISVADIPYQDLVTAAREANLAVLRRLQGPANEFPITRGTPCRGRRVSGGANIHRCCRVL